MPASTYAGNAILNELFRGVAYAAPARVYLSLHTADPGLTGASEVATGAWPSYVRKDPANGGAVGGGFSAAAAKAISNAQQVLWPAHDGAGTVTITHFGIFDAATAGNFLFGGALTASKAIAPTDEVKFNIGELDIVVDP